MTSQTNGTQTRATQKVKKATVARHRAHRSATGLSVIVVLYLIIPINPPVVPDNHHFLQLLPLQRSHREAVFSSAYFPVLLRSPFPQPRVDNYRTTEQVPGTRKIAGTGSFQRELGLELELDPNPTPPPPSNCPSHPITSHPIHKRPVRPKS